MFTLMLRKCFEMKIAMHRDILLREQRHLAKRTGAFSSISSTFVLDPHRANRALVISSNKKHNDGFWIVKTRFLIRLVQFPVILDSYKHFQLNLYCYSIVLDMVKFSESPPPSIFSTCFLQNQTPHKYNLGSTISCTSTLCSLYCC